jgi:hypothetical protein
LGALALILCGTVLAAGCQEKLSGGAACPALCPEQSLSFKDTVLDAVIDTDVAVTGFPVLGTEPSLLAASAVIGTDTLRSVGVVHFDALQSTFPPTATDSSRRPFVTVDSASLNVELAPFPEGLDTVFVRGDSVTIRLYNVDTTGSIFDTDAIAPLIRADRLIPGAVRTVARDSIAGTLQIPLPDTLIQRAVLGGEPLAFGIAAGSPDGSSVQVRVISREGGTSTTLKYVGRDGSSRTSVTVAENASVQGGVDVPQLADYTVVLRGTMPPDPTMLAVGGLPASRSYIRFDLPASIVESTTVVRASLLLVQRPDTRFLSGDSVTVVPRLVRARASITEPAKASALAAPDGFVDLQPLTILPQGSGPQVVELVPAIRFWKAATSIDLQRAIVLQISNEGIDPRQVLFYSTNAAVPDSLRPRLRLSYIPRASFGLP